MLFRAKNAQCYSEQSVSFVHFFEVRLRPAPVLKLLDLVVDLVDVHFDPQYVVVPVHLVDDVIVQTVQLLKQAQLFFDLQCKRAQVCGPMFLGVSVN